MPKFRKILVGLLLAIFASYYCETTCFVHSHVSELGIVTHSHPYLPGASHSHTSLELQALNVLAAVVFTAVGLGFALAPHRELTAVIAQRVLSSVSLGHIFTRRIRGPTDFICI